MCAKGMRRHKLSDGNTNVDDCYVCEEWPEWDEYILYINVV